MMFGRQSDERLFGTRAATTPAPADGADGMRRGWTPDNQGERWRPLLPTMALPKGGAVRGLQEALSGNPVTGGAGLDIPLGTPAGRNGFGPDLQLSYDSNGGNGPFGMGWNLGLPAVTLRTERGVPLYRDDDVVVAGSPVVPQLDAQLEVMENERTVSGVTYRIRRFRPRVENGHERIERWTNLADPADVRWRVLSAGNTTTWYGTDPESRIADPADPRRIAAWLPSLAYDDRGNAISFVYAVEDATGVDLSAPHEAHRDDTARTANRYLREVRWANLASYLPTLGSDGDPTPLPQAWLFRAVLDYGDHDDDDPRPAPDRPWPPRPDPFSSSRTGFEVRTYRRCRRVLIYHQFPEVGPDPVLVSSTELRYRDQGAEVASLLAEVVRTGYASNDAGGHTSRSLPGLVLRYATDDPDLTVRTVDREAVSGDPIGLDGDSYEWVDLDGDGAAGILARRGRAWFYKRNLSPLSALGPDGPQVRFARPIHVRDVPAGVPSSAGQPRPDLPTATSRLRPALIDLDGDGALDLLELGGPAPGAARRSATGWGPFTAFPASPAVDLGKGGTWVADLTGDGRADVLVQEGEHSRWYRGLGVEGFGPPEAASVRQAPDEGPDPLLLASDERSALLLADMDGDDLLDLVRVTRTQVSYWPSLGHGRFGARVDMDNSPVLDSPDAFDANRVVLADTDGCGPFDLVYLGDVTVLYRNQSGNGWSGPTMIPGSPPPDRMGRAAVVDLFGRGTACVAWSTRAPRPDGLPLHYVDLYPQGKPRLLTGYDNGLGSSVELRYTPSTAYRLRDKLDGRPWATRLPFPVHCLSSTTVTDGVRGTRFTTTTSYAHGHYDGREREFRGFGRVDQRDTEVFAEGPDDLPPTLTRRWFHVGAPAAEADALLHAFRLEYADLHAPVPPDPGLPDGLDAEGLAEAARALAGVELRREVYAEDGSAQHDIPYLATESTYRVRQVQAAGPNRHAAFQVLPVQQTAYASERDLQDPRVSQGLVLETDDLGRVTRSAVVLHPRRQDDPALPPAVREAQRRLLVAYAEFDSTADVTGPDVHRLRMTCERRAFQLTGLPVAPGAVATVEDLRATIAAASDVDVDDESPAGTTRRLIGRSQVVFLDTDLQTPLPLGTHAAHGQVFESYELTLTPEMVPVRYGTDIGDADLEAAGYVHRDDTAWWVPSGRWEYDADARDHFLVPRRMRDGLGATAVVEYLHDLLPTAMRNGRGHEVSAEYDLRTLCPRLLVDPNGNRSAARYDELGAPTAVAVMGRPGAGEGDTLDDPTMRIEYDLDRWRTAGLPAVIRTFARERHGAANPRWQESRTYVDGAGATMAIKAQAAPGLAGHWDAATGTLSEVDTSPAPRWVGTGRTVLNNKLLPVRQYEPYFSDTPEFDSAEAVVEAGVTNVVRYDPLGRAVRVDHPDGTAQVVQFDPWRGVQHDPVDTVLGSRWYLERGSPDPAGPEPAGAEERAAWLAARSAGTPSITYLDVLGRPVLTQTDNGGGDLRTSRSERDATGVRGRAYDTRDRLVLEVWTDLLGTVTRTETAERGPATALSNVLGIVVLARDALGRAFRVDFDDLHRPVRLHCLPAPGGQDLVLSLLRYGDDLPGAPVPNGVGRAVQVYDQAGRVEVDGYDFAGAATAMTRRFALDPSTLPNWAPVASAADPDAAAEQLLSAETFRGAATHDALGRPLAVELPDGSVLTPAYDEGNRVATLDVLLPGAAAPTRFLAGQAHDAAGRPLQRLLGNGVTCDYRYDPESRRLSGLRAAVPGQAALQDLTFTYDPVGNVTGVDDAAQQTRFFANAVVPPARAFTYDALYQLVAATGRELAALSQPDHGDVPVQPLPHINDTMAVRRYTEQYTYDDLGNLTAVRHAAGAAGWARRYRYAYEEDAQNQTNRLRRTSVAGDPDGVFSAAYSHDALGNMNAMPHLASLDWDLLGRLAHVDLGGGGDALYCYGSAAGRARKVVQRQGGLRVETLYLGAVELVRETLNGVLRRERWTMHVADDVSRIAQVDRMTVDAAGPLPPATVRYLHSDELGSAILETDDAGNPISYEEYHPFGSTAYRSVGAGHDISLKRYRYLDRERDDETGLYHLGARYYAAWLGRWTSPDPAGFVDGPNLYSYCRNNPVSLRDRSGLQTETKTFYKLPADVKTAAQVEAWLRARGFDFTGPVVETKPGTWDVGTWLRVPGQGPAEGTGGGGGDSSAATGPPAAGTGPPTTPPGPPSGGGQAEGPQGPPAPPDQGGGNGDTPPPGSGEGPGTLGSSLAQTPAGAERFIWQYDFPGTGVAGTQRGRILEWMYGVPWRDNGEAVDVITDTAAKQIKSTESFDEIGDITRSATRDAQRYITENPATMAGRRPQAVVITPTDAPASAAADIRTALNPGRGRRIPPNALPPEHVRGLPGTPGMVGRAFAVGGTGLSAWALVEDIRTGDVPMGAGDALSTVGGGFELYAIASPGATVAGASALSAGLVLGGAGIAIASGVSAYRAYQRGDTAGVVAGVIGVAAGVAIVAGVVFSAPVVLAVGLVAAVGVGLYHAAKWLGSLFDWW